MITGLYCIKDTKTTFWKPFVHHNDLSAQREFSNLVNSGNELVSANVEDFELWCLGTYDDVTGAIVSELKFICNGVSVKKVTE